MLSAIHNLIKLISNRNLFQTHGTETAISKLKYEFNLMALIELELEKKTESTILKLHFHTTQPQLFSI